MHDMHACLHIFILFAFMVIGIIISCVICVCMLLSAVYIARMGSQIICPYRDEYAAKDLKVSGERGQTLLLVICSL